MKKAFIVLYLVFFSAINFAQENREYEFVRETSSKKISEINQFPIEVQKTVKLLYENIFNEKVKFTSGQINNLKKYFQTKQLELNKIVPKHEMKFLFTDSAKGIMDFIIYLGIDEFGQIIKTNYSLLSHNIPVESIISKYKVLEFAANYYFVKEIKSEKLEAELITDEESNQLFWEISNYQPYSVEARHQTINHMLLDPTDGSFVKELLNSFIISDY